MGVGKNDLPSIMLPHELLQALLIHTMERNKQRIDLGDSDARHNVPHGGTTV